MKKAIAFQILSVLLLIVVLTSVAAKAFADKPLGVLLDQTNATPADASMLSYNLGYFHAIYDKAVRDKVICENPDKALMEIYYSILNYFDSITIMHNEIREHSVYGATITYLTTNFPCGEK